ncbi:MAG TPA: FAD-dependent monooxygenase [Chloroflexaceae bacterium]|nr:FAD-dependent monooxygenase [Chloroflexaceae bacterium]
MNTNTQVPVLIVGAGPTGLTVANILARRGVAFRIVECDAGPIDQSRALWVHARTLEYWSRLGIIDAALTQGRQTDRIGILVHGQPTGVMPYRGDAISPFPYGLILEQSKTQRLLLASLAEYGGAVDWRTELTVLSQDGAGVTAVLRRPDGREETVRADYLVGADGAGSAVREALGLSFEGDTFPQSFFLADVEMDWELGHEQVYLSLAKAGAFAFLPMQGPRQFRLIGTTPPELNERTSLEPHEVEQLVNRQSGVQVTLRKTNWATVFRSHRRIAARFQVGRCFLVGDAAHIHTPAGGQGMNLGIGDAYNLGWKLAEVLVGAARPALLASYEAERLPIARAVIRRSDQLFDLEAGGSPLMQYVRQWVFPVATMLMTRSTWAQRVAFTYLSQTWPAYPDSPAVMAAGKAGKTAGAGERAPFARLAAGDTIYDRLTGLDHQLLVFGDTPAGLAELLRHYDVSVQVVALGENEAEARRSYGVVEPTLMLLRPDGHIGFRGPLTQLDAFAGYLDRHYMRRAERGSAQPQPERAQARRGELTAASAHGPDPRFVSSATLIENV